MEKMLRRRHIWECRKASITAKRLGVLLFGETNFKAISNPETTIRTVTKKKAKIGM